MDDESVSDSGGKREDDGPAGAGGVEGIAGVDADGEEEEV